MQKKNIVLYCVVSVKSKNCFYIIHLFRKCSWFTSIYKSSDTALRMSDSDCIVINVVAKLIPICLPIQTLERW